MRTTWIILAVVVGLSCQDPENSSFTGDFRIKLVDAPAAFNQVNIVVRRISVHRASASATFGWGIISEDVASFDLLNLRNGVSATMVSASLPSGRYDGIIVLFGTSNLLEDGFERTVEIPFAIRNGAEIDIDFERGRGPASYNQHRCHSAPHAHESSLKFSPGSPGSRSGLPSLRGCSPSKSLVY
ncbi:MAG: DUF4382 domain-containing protein [Bacteroidota bacterium]